MLQEIRAYLALYPQHDELRFVEIMQRLDTVYLKATGERQARKRKEKAT